jgi:hypothetical protein
MRYPFGIPVENPEERDHFGAVGVDWVIILKWTIKKQASDLDLIHIDEDRIHLWNFLRTA